MIAADDDRCLDVSRAHQLVDLQSKPRALSVAEPADACRQSLKRNSIARHVYPAAQRVVISKHLERCFVGHAYVFGISGERGPAKRSLALTEERTHIFRHEARNVKRIFNA